MQIIKDDMRATSFGSKMNLASLVNEIEDEISLH